MGCGLAVWGRLYAVRGETGEFFVGCASGGTKSCSKPWPSMGEENVAANGSASTSDFWYDKRMSRGVFGSMEPSSVMVTADTAFEKGLDVSGPYGSTGLDGGIMSGLRTFGGSWAGGVWVFLFGLSRRAEAKFPNIEGCFVDRSGMSPSACKAEYVRDRVVSRGLSLVNLGEDLERDHQ